MGVYYDFASTMCFVAQRVVDRISPELAALGVRLRWRPLDFTWLTGWQRGRPFRSEARRKAEVVAADLHVPVAHPPDLWMDSRPASEHALALSEEREESFRQRVWSEVYDAGRDLGGEDLLRELAVDAPMEFPRLEAETRRARELGVAGVPSFVLGEWPVGGIQDDATMLRFLGRFAERQRARAQEN